MKFSNNFEVALPPDRAWNILLDIQRIAPCMPGAELTEVVDDRTYRGKVAVRIGPVALSFAGTAQFEQIDEANRSAVVRAQGSDSKGRGGASALVGFKLEPSIKGTKVVIDTDLNLTGTVAQYGRASGVVQSIAGQLIGQFAASLEKMVIEQQPTSASNLDEGASPQQLAAPAPAKNEISGFSLVFKALWVWLRGLFGR